MPQECRLPSGVHLCTHTPQLPGGRKRALDFPVHTRAASSPRPRLGAGRGFPDDGLELLEQCLYLGVVISGLPRRAPAAGRIPTGSWCRASLTSRLIT
jgi:hypothetical protein